MALPPARLTKAVALSYKKISRALIPPTGLEE
jgi:hypothetical protein